MTTTRETADHAGLAIVAWAERGPESRELCDVQLFDALTDEEREAGWISEPLVTAAYADALLSEIAALRGEVDDYRLRTAELTGERDALQDSLRVARGDDLRHLQQATQAERQRDELRKALEPFAEAAESLDDETRDHDHIWEQPAAIGIDAGHLRTARALLANQGAE